MSRYSFMSVIVKVIAIHLAIRSVLSYENAYDLLERKQQRYLYEPQEFHSPGIFHDSRRRITQNYNPYSDYRNLNPYFTEFGNGYDNIGNGVPSNHFQHFRQPPRDWRLFYKRPLRERIYTGIGFEDYSRPIYMTYYPRRNYYHYINDSPITKVQENEFESKRTTSHGNTERVLEGNENKNHKKTDEIYTRSSEGVNVDSVKKEKSGEQSHTDQTGENKTSLRSNKVVRKGYTTRGFASHHHKDETGNSTTFFDESSDYGGQSDVRDLADGFGTRRTLEQITQKGDEKFFKENGEQEESFRSGVLKENKKFEKDFSSSGGQSEFEGQHESGKGEDDLRLHKSYRYLNGDRFDYSAPHADNYY